MENWPKRVRANVALSIALASCACAAALELAPDMGLYAYAAITHRDRLHTAQVQGDQVPLKYLTFTHLTANEGLSQSNVNTILQDRRGFMWFATHDGLNRYDGNTFVVYKNNPSDPASLSGNFLTDLVEDDQGYLWITTQTGGVSKFDPKTERFTAYRHDPGNPNSIGDGPVTSIARDAHGYLWLGTEERGLEKFDPSTGRFTSYLNDRIADRSNKAPCSMAPKIPSRGHREACC